MFGASEWGARFFFALSAIAALMAVYWAGAGLLRRRAGLLATLALGTMPLFVLEARQLTSDAPAHRGAGPGAGWARALRVARRRAAALAGSRRRAGGRRDRRAGRRRAVGPGAAHPVDGAGPVDRTRPPGRGPRRHPGRHGDAGGPGNRTQTSSRAARWAPARSGPARRGFVPLVLLVLAAAALGLAAVGRLMAGKYSWLLGGVARVRPADAHLRDADPRAGIRPVPLERGRLLRAGPPAHAPRYAGRRGSDAGALRTNPRLLFVELYLLFFAGLGLRLLELPRHRAGPGAVRGPARHRAGDRRLHRRGAGGRAPRAGRRAADGDRDDGRRARLLPVAGRSRLGAPVRQGSLADHAARGRADPGRRLPGGAGRVRRAGRARPRDRRRRRASRRPPRRRASCAETRRARSR